MNTNGFKYGRGDSVLVNMWDSGKHIPAKVTGLNDPGGMDVVHLDDGAGKKFDMVKRYILPPDADVTGIVGNWAECYPEHEELRI